MYAISSDNDRRASHRGPERPELPILFHLVDVSRPRPAASEALTSGASLEAAKAEAVALPSVAATAPPVKEVQSAETSPFKLLSAPSLLAADQSLASMAAAKIEEPIELVAVPPQTSAEQLPTASSSIVSSPLVETSSSTAKTSADAAPTVTLKAKTVERRQRRTPPSEDWFASHGKFMAIAFVVALIGTVYFARTNRQAATTKAEGTTQAPLVELRPAEPPAESVAKNVQTVAAVSDSKVELQPPSAPPLIASMPTSEKVARGGDKLFDFPATAKGEQRIASRPVSPAPDLSRTPTQSPTAKDLENAAPALAPAYPVTSSPATYPTTGATTTAGATTTGATATAGAYPQTAAPTQSPAPAPPSGTTLQGPANAAPSYGSQFPPQSYQQPPYQQPPYQQPPYQQPPPQQASPQQTAPASGWSPPTSMNGPGQYQPIDNTARGPRYEHTGSGRY